MPGGLAANRRDGNPWTVLPCLFLLLRSGVPRFGFGVHGIEARQYRAVIDLVDDPAFHSLLLGAFGQYMVKEGLGDDDRTILIGNDHVIRENGNAAAADRFAPTDKCQSGD